MYLNNNNILTIDIDKLRIMIANYMLDNKQEIFLDVGTTTFFNNKPIILMSKETLKILKRQLKIDETKTIQNYPMFDGCKIAIADWLYVGEIELR